MWDEMREFLCKDYITFSFPVLDTNLIPRNHAAEMGLPARFYNGYCQSLTILYALLNTSKVSNKEN